MLISCVTANSSELAPDHKGEGQAETEGVTVRLRPDDFNLKLSSASLAAPAGFVINLSLRVSD